MHVAFIPYGARQEVEILLRDMESQKFWLPLRKGEETKTLRIHGQIRVLPGGVYEYIFPKEYLDAILNTFKAKAGREHYISNLQKKIIRKMIRLKPIPKDYSTKMTLLWDLDCVGVIVLGIREDKDITDPSGEMMGWTHEAF